MKRFNDQTIIVTGGTRGIGRGITEAFLREGACVIALYRSNHKSAEDFKDNIGELSEKLITKSCDISDSKAVDDFYLWLGDNHSDTSVLVNNSGIRKDAITPLMSDDDFTSVIETNLFGTFYMTKRIIPILMQNRYGRIINMSSIAGKLGLPGQGNYSASKAAQVAFSKSLSKEVAKKGITVNNVLPGFIETELIADLPAEQVKEYKKQVPMRRFGKVEEVANAVLFLASKDAGYITGSSLEITGGL